MAAEFGESIAERANEGADATARLTGELSTAKEALKKLQDVANVDIFAKNPIAKASHDVAELTGKLRDLAKASKEAELAQKAAAPKIASDSARMLSDRSKYYHEQRAIFQEQEASAAKSKTWLQNGGESLAEGAKSALTYAAATGAALIAGGAALVKSGVAYGIEQTSSRIKQVAILDKLTKGQGAIAEEVAKSLGAATGITADTAIAKVKGLVAAGFDRTQTEQQFRASADI